MQVPAAYVDRASPLPVYFQIARDLRRRIEQGEWRTGEAIPAEPSLAREYDVSRVTVRQALADLVKDDLLERRRGSGTYVRDVPRPLVHDLALTTGALAARLRQRGFENRAEVLEVGQLVDPPDQIRHRLQLPASANAIFMVRRLVINEEPTAIYRSWFNADLVPGLDRSKRLSGSLSVELGEAYGLVPVRSENALEVVRSTREEAALLGVRSDEPLLVLTTTSYLADGRPLEHAQLGWLGDRIRFHITATSEGLARGDGSCL